MQIRRRLNEDKWTISIVSKKEMYKLSKDENTGGLCVSGEKQIYICEDSVDYGIVAHELVHGYFSYLYLSDTKDIQLSDAEEIFAEFFANKGEIIVKKAKSITKALKKLQEAGEEE